MSDVELRDYLDAKFEAVHVKVDAAAKLYAEDREALFGKEGLAARVGRLELWRSSIVGAIGAISALAVYLGRQTLHLFLFGVPAGPK